MQTGQFYKLLIRLFNFLVNVWYKSLFVTKPRRQTYYRLLLSGFISLIHIVTTQDPGVMVKKEPSSLLTHSIQTVDNFCYI